MARTTFELTDTWQEVSAGQCIISVSDPGKVGRLYLNETAVDDGALVDLVQAGDQFAQTETKTVQAKGEGVVIIVDTAG